MFDKDAQRYAKLRNLAESGKLLGRSVEIDLDNLDASVDELDISVLPMVEELHSFAEFVTIVLDDLCGGFADAYKMGGTGIYRDGFYWRCLRPLTRADKWHICQLLDHVLAMPEHATLAALVGPPHIEKEHEEDYSVVMKWTSEPVAHRFDDIKGPVASLLFGDLAIMQ